jgi:hypothetical protein
MTLALLITAVGGAWAQTETLLTTITATGTEQASYSTANMATVSFSTTAQGSSQYLANWGWWGYGWIATVTAAEGYTITKCIFYDDANRTATDSEAPFVVETTEEDKTPQVNGTPIDGGNMWSKGIKKIEVYGYVTPAAGPEVTLNEASTEATMEMPASDVTVTYELVRDMQDEANPVTFSGLPTNDEPIVVKKGDDGKYQPAETLTIQLIDPLAAADAQNIIQADDITITVGKMVEVEGFEGYRQFDEATAVSLADFLANPQPGTYKMKATATADGPYDGTVYSAEFTTVEKYDLLIQPADEYSKGKLTEVTVAGAAQTLDADGKVTTTAEPGKEVKLKAKTGYVIEKVEAKKPVTSAIVNPQVGQIIGSDGKNYAADATLPSGVTAVAMIAYVGSETDDTDYTGGLAIALSNEGRMNWSTAKSTCEGKTAVTGAKWCLPSQNQWKAMFKANGGSESSYTGLNTAISTAGGTALQKICYWSSTEHGEVNAYYVYLFSGNAYFSNASKGIDYLVRAVLAF